MAVVHTVKIGLALRRYTGDVARADVAGDTVGAVLTALADRYPHLRPRLFGADGAVVAGLTLFVNDEDIRELDGLATPLAPGDELVLMPAMAGG